MTEYSASLSRSQRGVEISLSEHHAAMLLDAIQEGMLATIGGGTHRPTKEAWEFFKTLGQTLRNEWPNLDSRPLGRMTFKEPSK